MAPPQLPLHHQHQANHQMRMLQYYRHVSAAAAFNYPEHPEQKVERFVAEKPVEPCPKPTVPQGDSTAAGSKPMPNFRQFTVSGSKLHIRYFLTIVSNTTFGAIANFKCSFKNSCGVVLWMKTALFVICLFFIDSLLMFWNLHILDS